jgi:spore coat protein GerQ
MNTYFNEEIFPNQYKEKKENTYIKKDIILPSIEELIKYNKGKKVTIHMGFPNKTEQKDIIGIIEQSNEEYLTLSDPQTGAWHILPNIYIDYITFDENINYN